jgi:hypothetical protein
MPIESTTVSREPIGERFNRASLIGIALVNMTNAAQQWSFLPSCDC